ncbi:MAG: 50S ribosomal protein L15 [Chitinivibrionales bacterium]|nr:50S ribosomal protein L15 [Chitinivibrionales bacterium]
MIAINTLRPAKGSRMWSKRIGRGPGSGKGGTAGYGNNGDKARSGSHYKAYFEGGQTPMSRRIPKRGFTNMNKLSFQVVNIGALEKIDIKENEINPAWLFSQGLVKNAALPVKILGDGDFNKKLTIHAHAFSKIAREKIEKAKGKAEAIARV